VAFDAALIMGRNKLAIELCGDLILFLLLAYQINHPLVGLQLHTLGDLLEDVGEMTKSFRVLTVAYRTLKTSYGEEHEMRKGSSKSSARRVGAGIIWIFRGFGQYYNQLRVKSAFLSDGLELDIFFWTHLFISYFSLLLGILCE